MLHLRLATPDDLADILALSNHYALTTPANFAVEPETIDQWRADFARTHERYPWLVAFEQAGAEDAGRFVGFAKASPWKGRCAYHWSAEVTVYVAPGAQGNGVGRALYTQLTAILRAQGYRTLLGGITQPNVASVRLHESLGFEPVALLRRVGYKFGTWHDVGYWELILNENDDTPPMPVRTVKEVVVEHAKTGWQDDTP